jgi:tRNA threonylcarbamoyladenosine biosynthesis protein TsaB
MAAVSNLKALAWFGESPLRAVVIDARRGDVYAGLYNAALEPVRPEMVIKLEAWLASLPAEAEIITANPALLAGHDLPIRVVEATQIARAIAHIAASQLVDPALTDANYVRRADAEMNWVDR